MTMGVTMLARLPAKLNIPPLKPTISRGEASLITTVRGVGYVIGAEA